MNSRKNQFLLVLILPLILLLGLVYKPLLAYFTGESITVKTVPVDPRDLLYGDYVYLRLDINTVSKDKLSKEIKETLSEYNKDINKLGQRNIEVYSILEKDGEFYTVQSVSMEKPKRGIYLKGELLTVYHDTSSYFIDYGLDRFYVEENTGGKFETQKELALLLKVADGYALMEDIILLHE